jgi:hypothetical protein
MHRSLRAERLPLKKHNEVQHQPALFQHESKSGDEFSLKSVAGILENLTSDSVSDHVKKMIRAHIKIMTCPSFGIGTVR